MFVIAFCACAVIIVQHIKSEATEKRLQDIYEEVVIIREMVEKDCQYVDISAYHPRSKGINSDSNPYRTATMTKPIPGWTCAISDELFNLGWLGKTIYIDGVGIRKANDRMGKSIAGKQIDLCMPNLQAALKFGKRKDSMAIVLN